MVITDCDSADGNMDSSSDSTIKDEFPEASFYHGPDQIAEQHIDFCKYSGMIIHSL